ncbi:MAG: glycoside hydrolase family 29, partial [Planctomycetes bacterium]|nr:glycoside hydrolase family 29 [Planctomycetota bacterium]
GNPLATTQGRGTLLELDLPQAQPVNYLILQEDIHQGERIRRYVVEAEVEGRWQPVAQGTSVGHKKIDRISPVTTRKLRLHVLEAVAPPVVRKLAAY